jgi:RimJ/RimL family protein N-acetyltransferase
MPETNVNAIAASFEFETPRLHVRPLRGDDETLYCDLYTDAETHRHTGSRLSPPDAARSFAAALSAPYRRPLRNLYLMLSERTGRRKLGMLGLSGIDMAERRTEIGILMTATARRAGYGREGFGALAAQIFLRFPIDTIYVQYARANIGADRLAAGVGFRDADHPDQRGGADQRVVVMYRGK